MRRCAPSSARTPGPLQQTWMHPSRRCVRTTWSHTSRRDAMRHRTASHGRGAAPFDLARPAAARTLRAHGAARHVLLLTLHHIVADGWSMGVLWRDLVALYGEAAGGGRRRCRRCRCSTATSSSGSAAAEGDGPRCSAYCGTPAERLADLLLDLPLRSAQPPAADLPRRLVAPRAAAPPRPRRRALARHSGSAVHTADGRLLSAAAPL